MKKRFCAFLLLLALSVSLCLLPAYADELWSEDYYRVYDCSDEIVESDRDELDAECIEFMKRFHADLALLCVTEDERDEVFTREQAEQYYSDCGFGYGENHDGFLWVYDANNEEIEVFCFGAAETMLSEESLEHAKWHGLAMSEDMENGVIGAFRGGIQYLTDFLVNPDWETGAARVGESSNLPPWYPVDTSIFAFYHDAVAPRVVDNADILTDAEEQQLTEQIADIRRDLKRDIVIYTDVTSYGFDHKTLAADFYDYNGYGYGDEREGVCLYIDMDPNDRGWFCCCTGSRTMALYTEDAANLIDDALYAYMAAGDYGAGILNWVQNIRNLYVKGSPFAPDWYPDEGETIELFHDPDAPRVVDDALVLSEAEVAALTEEAARVADKLGMDVAIHTMYSPVGLVYAEVSDLYYRHMGYGYGDGYDGILLSVYKRAGYYATTRITAVGAAAEKLTDTNLQRLRDACEDKMHNEQYYDALSQWIEQVGHMERTGRVPRSAGYWGVIAAVSAALGSIFGGISLGVA
ncbi:MAG: TPM domain-containing protein, partial [Kiritimatiellae bacterium]|nr:TPM domain-containing protein [Kiritimatiellia bacterium]